MSHIQGLQIITRIREIIEEGKGSLRQVASGRFTGAWPEGIGDDELARRGIATAKPTQVIIRRLGRHPNSPPVGGNLEILRLAVEIGVSRTLDIEGQVDDDVRMTLEAEAMEDVDQIRNALEWPANLTTTEAGQATDLQALRLDEPASRINITRGHGKAFAAEYRLVFEGVALSRPAIVGRGFSDGFDEGFT